jgi:hypothetical protein
MRFDTNRSRSGGTALSFLSTMYLLGFVFHAGVRALGRNAT